MTKGYADIPEGQVSYRTEGSGEPLLLLHQRPMSLEEYSLMIPILAKSYRVVAMENLGCGYSDNLPLSAIGVNKTSIVGNHNGSSIAVEVAVAYPERVDKLTVSGLPFWEPERWQQFFNDMWYRIRPPADDGLFLTDWW